MLTTLILPNESNLLFTHFGTVSGSGGVLFVDRFVLDKPVLSRGLRPAHRGLWDCVCANQVGAPVSKWTVVTKGNPRGWLVLGRIVSSVPSYNGDRIRWEIEADGKKSVVISLKAGVVSIIEHF